VADTADNTRQTARKGQGISLGGRYARWLAPAGAGAAAVLEMIVVMAVAMGIAWAILPQNLLLLGFPWAWLLPVILALRYGTLVGVGAVLMLLGWFFSTTSARTVAFPRMFFLGGCCWCWWPGSSATCGTRAWRVRAP
jgi:hypothetical protein